MKQTKFANFHCSVPIITVSVDSSFQVEFFFQDLNMENMLRNSFSNQAFELYILKFGSQNKSLDPLRPKFGTWGGLLMMSNPDYSGLCPPICSLQFSGQKISSSAPPWSALPVQGDHQHFHRCNRCIDWNNKKTLQELRMLSPLFFMQGS